MSQIHVSKSNLPLNLNSWDGIFPGVMLRASSAWIVKSKPNLHLRYGSVRMLQVDRVN